MDFQIIIENIPLFLAGFQMTVILLIVSLLFGAILALIMALCMRSERKWLSQPARAYVFFFRGTPGLVQVFMIYYGAGQFAVIRESFLWVAFQEPLFCALLGLTLNTGAYTTAILKGALDNTPKGLIEGGLSLGLNPSQILRFIILPNAIRRAIPAYSNEVIAQLHTTAIVSTITIVDLTGAARRINSVHYSPYEAFLPAAFFYLLCTFAIVGIFKIVEKRIQPISI